MFPHASTQAVFLVLTPVQPHSLHPSDHHFLFEPMPGPLPHQGPVPMSLSPFLLHLLQVVLPSHSPDRILTSLPSMAPLPPGSRAKYSPLKPSTMASCLPAGVVTKEIWAFSAGSVPPPRLIQSPMSLSPRAPPSSKCPRTACCLLQLHSVAAVSAKKCPA